MPVPTYPARGIVRAGAIAAAAAALGLTIAADGDDRGKEPAIHRRSAGPTDDPGSADRYLVDPTHSLHAFFAALDRLGATDQPLVRVTQMGDSSIGRDQLPHYLRTRFQDRFGDGGAGFVLLQPHSANYRNRLVHLTNPRPWRMCFIIFRCRRDGHYGLGGVAVESRGGATTTLSTRRRGPYGRAASRIELWYAARPRGGDLEVRVDRTPPLRVSTRSPHPEDRAHEVRVPLGPHRVQIRAAGRGPVLAYGAVLETDGPGVVWDTLSMMGAFTVRLLAQDEAHFTRQLQLRNPNLVLLNYGGNDLRRYVGGAVTVEEFTEETSRLLKRVRRAVPHAGCLLMSMTEHERSGATRISGQHVADLVGAQQRAARQAGCAFYNTYQAMGGKGAFRRWRRQGLAAADRKHLTAKGRKRVAEWVYAALTERHRRFRATRSSDELRPATPGGRSRGPHE